jgi:tetratricopeptide (TPR) repeat protein
MSDRLALLKKMHSNDPNDTFVLYALAKEFETLGNLEAALEVFLKLLQQDPDYIGLYYHLGKLYEVLGMNDLALQTYDKGLLCGKRLNDFHSIAELNNAKTNLEMEM